MTATSGGAPRFVITWVPFVIALTSFAVSMYSFAASNRTPVLEVVLPQQIRIAQGEEYGYAYAYFQPTFVHAGPSTQVEVVRAMRLDVAPAAGGDGASLEWRESGRIDFDPATQGTSYVYERDASPLLLSRETAQSPLGTFYGPPGWFFTPGEWRGTLVAERAGGRPPLEASFRFSLSAADLETINLSGGTIFVPFSITPE